MSLLDCDGCGAVIPCGNIADGDLYSMEDQPLGFVFDCPPGYDCQIGSQLFFQCCDTVLEADFPAGATFAQMQSILNNIASQCIRLQTTCGGGSGPPGTPPGTPPGPGNPTQLFFSRPQVCTSKCPDGNVFTYTTRQAIAVAFTQAQADALAHAIACQQAAARKICLSKITTLCCLSNAFTTTVHATGGIGPYTWEITSGALPDGLTLGGFSPNVDATPGPSETIEGTPTVAGPFAFTLKVTDTLGNSMSKDYTMCASDVLPHTLTAPSLGTAYSQTFTDTQCIGTPIAWSVSAGSLPSGLSLNATTGVLSGTPTGGGASTFTIKATGPTGTCSRAYSVTVNGDLCVNITDWNNIVTAAGAAPFPGPFSIGSNHFTFTAPGSWIGQANPPNFPQTSISQDGGNNCLLSIQTHSPTNAVWSRSPNPSNPAGVYTLIDPDGIPGLPATITIAVC